MTSKILAIVPAYNEEENIVSTIEDLKSSAPGVDCVVIDDGSRDRTAAICRERGYRCISLPVNLGLAGGFQTGMKYALRHGYDYAIQFDADGQHSAAYIEPMVEFARASNANIVIGSRFCSQKRPPFSPHGRFGAHLCHDPPYDRCAHQGSHVGYAPIRQIYDSSVCQRA